MKTIVAIWTVLFGIFEVYIQDKPPRWLYLGVGIQMVLMSLLYLVVIVVLYREMRELYGDLKTATSSITCQFTIYLVAYLVRAIYCFVVYFSDILNNYHGAVLFSLSYLPENILPATYVLYQHHKVFSGVRSTVDHEQEEEDEEVRDDRATVHLQSLEVPYETARSHDGSMMR